MINCRAEFPIFGNRLDRDLIIYADSAATTLKPKSVIEAVGSFYNFRTANVLRGGSSFSEEATLDYLKAREKIADLINATSDEIIFSRGATDSLNIICDGLRLSADDEVIVSLMEHHSNIAPWINKCRLKFAPIDENGRVDVSAIRKLITAKTKIIAVTYVSNVTGIVQPIEEIARLAKEHEILCLVDASQAISHLLVDVKHLGVDFLCFSGHKMFGPSGVGCIYGKRKHLENLLITRFGGGMLDNVDEHMRLTLKPLPYALEPGTPNIEGVLGLGKAVDFIQKSGIRQIEEHNAVLLKDLLSKMKEISGVQILYQENEGRIPIVTFRIFPDQIDQSHLARMLGDGHGVVLSYGRQCASPFYNSLKIEGAIRASFHVYNTSEEVDAFVNKVELIARLWRK